VNALQDTVVLLGTNFGPSTEADNRLSVTFTHAQPDESSLTFVGVNCAVTASHVNITCTSPIGIGAGLVWTALVDGQASYTPGTSDVLPAGVSVGDVSTSYTRPWVRDCCCACWA
jgi:hypothetical protein